MSDSMDMGATPSKEDAVSVPRWALEFVLKNADLTDEGYYDGRQTSEELQRAIDVLERATGIAQRREERESLRLLAEQLDSIMTGADEQGVANSPAIKEAIHNIENLVERLKKNVA